MKDDLPPLAFIYARLSENRTDETENTDYQEKRARSFCEAEGAEVFGVYTDNNISGSKLLQRKKWDRLWEDIGELAASTDRPLWVVSRDTDRLTRNKREAIDVMDKIEETGARVLTYDRAFDSGRPEWEDDLMYRVMGGERYSRSISKNQRAKQEKLLAEGAWRGGPRPFGFYPQVGTKLRNNVERPAYDQTQTRPEEAALIKSGTEAILRGDTLASVARAWNASGVPTSMGKRWSIQSVKSVLVRWRNAGLIEHKGSIHGVAAWPAIVAREDVAAVREILNSGMVQVPANGKGAPEREQARRSTTNRRGVHLLSGVLTCHCGGRMNQKKMGKNVAYSCKVCHRNINYDAANERAVSYVVARLAAGDHLVRFRAGENLARLTELAHELASLAEDEEALRSSKVSMKLLIAEGERIESRRTEVEAERARIRRADAIAGLIEGIAPQPLNLHGETTAEREAVVAMIRERFEELAHGEKVTVLRALARFEVLPHPKGTRPSMDSASHRIKITVVDPTTGEPYIEGEQVDPSEPTWAERLPEPARKRLREVSPARQRLAEEWE